ncbi:hypothetical protein MCC01998_17370 [Bifidobacteriaceae bacterium MCC01998]|nr:hypothetical protein MCC02037_01250 [Bifidobacteriaceae bacterium MCC02037]GDZ67258.1 hypothetical protein MCC01988_01250 [Bifidobacteriaceae bacterium MCC01988]GDZ74662.1 hypothetical protein MCC01998_17370 [Bifidobacteriaceae bacterium MCC01998]
MRDITNYASSPLTVFTVNDARRVDFKGWNIASGVPTKHVVSAYCQLVSGTGTIRFGWDIDHTLNKSGRLTAYPTDNIFPTVFVVTTGDAVWKINRMIVTSQEEYSLLMGEYGLDYFDGDLMPRA